MKERETWGFLLGRTEPEIEVTGKRPAPRCCLRAKPSRQPRGRRAAPRGLRRAPAFTGEARAQRLHARCLCPTFYEEGPKPDFSDHWGHCFFFISPEATFFQYLTFMLYILTSSHRFQMFPPMRVHMMLFLKFLQENLRIIPCVSSMSKSGDHSP